MYSEYSEEFEFFIAQVSAEYGIAEDFSIRKPDFLVSTQIGSSLLKSGFGKLVFRITIFNIEQSFSSTFMKDKIKLKSVLCDLTPGFVHLWLSHSLQLPSAVLK